MTKETKTIVNTSFITFMYEVEEAFKEGYTLSTEYSPSFNFVVYDAVLEREQYKPKTATMIGDMSSLIISSDASKSLMSDLAATLDAPKKAGRPAKEK